MNTPRVISLAEEYCRNRPKFSGYSIEEADAFVAGYKAAHRWISVKDRLPEEGEEVLIFGQYLNDIPKILGVRSRYKGDQDWKYTWEGPDEWVYRENDVTHWMPLPEPPKEKK